MLVRLAVAVALVSLCLASGAVAGAQPTPTPPPTVIDGRPATECISANPRPDCYRSDEFDRSSGSHLLLFGLLGLAIVGIGVVVVRSTIRRDRTRHQPISGP